MPVHERHDPFKDHKPEDEELLAALEETVDEPEPELDENGEPIEAEEGEEEKPALK